MSTREARRAQMLTRVLEGTITLKEAAYVMGLSVRQARRLKSSLQWEGPAGLVHGNRGRQSPRRTDAATEAAVVAHYRGRYKGANVQHFTELIDAGEEIHCSVFTVRRILKAAGLAPPKTRRVAKHRARRERMPAEGMLLQLDGSPFRWLGPNGPCWSLLGAIDDATGDPVAAVFREQEDAAGYMLLLRPVVEQRGIPAAVYRDRHGIFEVSKRVRSTLEEDFAGARFPTQVGRLLAELGIASIPAYSPQAKGRVERYWRTQQDRLVTELRLAGIQTMAEANAFLPGYLERYRARFAIAPRSPESAYVPLGPETDLDRFFCFKYQRKVAPDNTVHFAGRVSQIPPGPERLSYARVVVDIHERLNGSIAVYYQGRQLVLLPASERTPPLRSRGHPYRTFQANAQPTPLAPAEAAAPTAPPRAAPAPRKPAPTHPWRRYPSKQNEQAAPSDHPLALPSQAILPGDATTQQLSYATPQSPIQQNSRLVSEDRPLALPSQTGEASQSTELPALARGADIFTHRLSGQNH